MKKIFTTSVLLIFSTLFLIAQPKVISAPINIAVLLFNDSTEEQMINACKYYSLTPTAEEEGYSVFIHPDGTKLRFQIPDDGAYPIIEVITTEKPKELEKTLQGLKFEKTSKGYERIENFESTSVLCTIIKTKRCHLSFRKIKRE